MKPELIARRQRGYTLLEMVVTLPLMTVLIVGAAGAVGIVSRVASDGGTTEAILRLPSALDTMAAELECATSVMARSATSISVVAPDRSGNAIDETIAYAWSGTAGDPLLRTVNGATAIAVAGVQNVSFNYQMLTLSSVNYLQSIEIRLLTASAASEMAFSIRCLNEPVLP